MHRRITPWNSPCACWKARRRRAPSCSRPCAGATMPTGSSTTATSSASRRKRSRGVGRRLMQRRTRLSVCAASWTDREVLLVVLRGLLVEVVAVEERLVAELLAERVRYARLRAEVAVRVGVADARLLLR